MVKFCFCFFPEISAFLLYEIGCNWNILPEIHKNWTFHIHLLIEKKKVLIKDIPLKSSIFTSVKLLWRGVDKQLRSGSSFNPRASAGRPSWWLGHSCWISSAAETRLHFCCPLWRGLVHWSVCDLHLKSRQRKTGCTVLSRETISKALKGCQHSWKLVDWM